MRLSFLAPIIAGGLALGFTASAAAQPMPPPSPPIFYCPASEGPPAAEAPPAAAWRGHMRHHRMACPSHHRRYAAAHHGRRHAEYAMAGPRHAPPPMAPPPKPPMGPPPMAMAPPPPPGPGCPVRCPIRHEHLFAAGDGVWRDGSYGAVFHVAGRDAFGYLIWPGKTAPGDMAP